MKAQGMGASGSLMIFIGLLISLGGFVVAAQDGSSEIMAKALGAAIAVGVAGLGAGFAIGVGGAAVASAIVEKREASGVLLLIVFLGEGIAIYGLLIALLIMLIL